MRLRIEVVNHRLLKPDELFTVLLVQYHVFDDGQAVLHRIARNALFALSRTRLVLF